MKTKKNSLEEKAAKAAGRSHCTGCPLMGEKMPKCIGMSLDIIDICVYNFKNGYMKGYAQAKKEMREKRRSND